MSRPLKLVVLGMMGRVPFAGQTWLYLNWLRGLSGLGHDVYYVEDDNVWPYDPRAETLTDDCSYAVGPHRPQHGGDRARRPLGVQARRPRGCLLGHVRNRSWKRSTPAATRC